MPDGPDARLGGRVRVKLPLFEFRRRGPPAAPPAAEPLDQNQPRESDDLMAPLEDVPLRPDIDLSIRQVASTIGVTCIRASFSDTLLPWPGEKRWRQEIGPYKVMVAIEGKSVGWRGKDTRILAVEVTASEQADRTIKVGTVRLLGSSTVDSGDPLDEQLLTEGSVKNFSLDDRLTAYTAFGSMSKKPYLAEHQAHVLIMVIEPSRFV